MARKVSIINMKGGVGKSTLCTQLAWHYSAKWGWDKRVLVVDLDPHGLRPAPQFIQRWGESQVHLSPVGSVEQRGGAQTTLIMQLSGQTSSLQAWSEVIVKDNK